MDPLRFDSLARSLATPRSRRGFLGGLAALVAGLAGGGVVRPEPADAQITPISVCTVLLTQFADFGCTCVAAPTESTACPTYRSLLAAFSCTCIDATTTTTQAPTTTTTTAAPTTTTTTTTTAAPVTQAYCGNVVCAGNPGVCKPGCACCVFGNGNSRCMPPGSCTGVVA